MTASPLGDPRLHLDPAGTVYLRGPLAGHGLRARGEAYLASDCAVGRCSTNIGHTVRQENGTNYASTRGIGHAVCRCGVLSPHLTTAKDRIAFHRAHKARVVLGQSEPAGQPKPVAPESIA